VWVIAVIIAAVNASERPAVVSDCDVVIAGGSLSALSAAFAAAEYFRSNYPTSPSGRNSTVCLLEPYDWAGGQLNSVPAIDFGAYMSNRANLPASFLYLWEIFNYGNPGNCWVSRLCFDPMVA